MILCPHLQYSYFECRLLVRSWLHTNIPLSLTSQFRCKVKLLKYDHSDRAAKPITSQCITWTLATMCSRFKILSTMNHYSNRQYRDDWTYAIRLDCGLSLSIIVLSDCSSVESWKLCSTEGNCWMWTNIIKWPEPGAFLSAAWNKKFWSSSENSAPHLCEKELVGCPPLLLFSLQLCCWH